jgi:transposase
VPDEERQCPHCGEDATQIGQGDVSVEYEWVAGYFRKRLHIVEAARCPCKQHYARGPAPVRVQEGCQYGPGFIAKLVVDKCADATPLYRIEKAMARAGIPVARSTMNDLVHLAADVCVPLWNAALAEVRIDPHVQADETSFRTQVRPERSFVWTFLSEQHTVYVYSPSRSGDTPKTVLGGSTGTLTVDGYTGYNNVTDVDGRERCRVLEPRAPQALRGDERRAGGERGARHHPRPLHGGEERTEPGCRRHAGPPRAAPAPQHRGARPTASLEREDRSPLRAEERDGAGARVPRQPVAATDSPSSRTPRFPSTTTPPKPALRIIALARKNSLFFGNDDAGSASLCCTRSSRRA